MESFLIEEGTEKRAYNSLVLEPGKLGILNSSLSVKIVQELAKKPGCALDVARSLKIHEQKIYYHLRKLESAGIINLLRLEKRYGMTAKIYGVVSPVISTKLYDDGFSLKKNDIKELQMLRFLKPFIDDGKLNATLIIGDPYPHGRHDTYSTSGPHTIDLAILFGSLVSNPGYPVYKLDIYASESDLKKNLILLGNSKENTVIERFNSACPFDYNPEKECFISRKTGKEYSDPRIGLIAKFPNPLAKAKWILQFSGIRTRGFQSSVIAFTQNTGAIIKSIQKDGSLSVLVEGLDKDGDGVIDSARVVE